MACDPHSIIYASGYSMDYPMDQIHSKTKRYIGYSGEVKSNKNLKKNCYPCNKVTGCLSVCINEAR